MEDMLTRFFENLVGRIHGPMNFRFMIQPLVATIYAVLDARKDARAGRPAWLWTVFTSRESRRELLHDGWKSVGKVFILATVLDIIYQVIVVRWIYPLETLVTAFFLAIIPYSILRGPLNRLISWMSRKGT